MAIRKRMNDSDTDANTKAVDSLLNYETVKYFGAERRETERYDRSMERYERASTQTYTSLAVLNSGQAVIFTIGMTLIMILAVRDITAGRATIGDFILVNALLVQLYIPLNFMGMIYREIKQALIDIDDLFGVLDRNPEIQDRPGATPLVVREGARPLRGRALLLHPRARDPARHHLRGAGRQDGGDRRAVGRRQVDDLAPALPLLRALARPHHDRRPGHRGRDARTRCAPRSAWCRRTRCCSTTRSATTSATASGTPGRTRWWRRPSSRRSTASSAPCRRATTRRSASAA